MDLELLKFSNIPSMKILLKLNVFYLLQQNFYLLLRLKILINRILLIRIVIKFKFLYRFLPESISNIV